MRIDVWSDVACPFCYIGDVTLNNALATFAHRDQVEVIYRSFQLDPSMPVDYDGDIYQLFEEKKGIPQEQFRAMNQNVVGRAAELGLTFNMERVVPTNTFDAHRLTHFARAQGMQRQIIERLFRAYFIDGEHVGRKETLADLAEEVGLNRTDALAVLESDHHRDDVLADIEMARRLGANGVPLFVINSKYGISGAQHPEVFSRTTEQAWHEEHPLVMAGTPIDPADGCIDGVCRT